MIGCEAFTSCPFAEITAASPWVIEITEACSRAADLHIPVADSLGRDLTCADLAAISEMQRGQSAAMKSDRDIAEQQRKKPETTP